MPARAVRAVLVFALAVPIAAQTPAGRPHSQPILAQALHTQSLDAGWQFRAVAAPNQPAPAHPEVLAWHPATVPGVVQTDLLHDGLIPDPFFADNEKRLQWIGNTDWQYSAHFNVDAATLARTHVELVFDGLDTLAAVSLNGQPLLNADNQFRQWRADVRTLLHPGQNTLDITFRSPVTAVAAMAAKLPYIIPGPGYETLDRAKGIYPTSQFVRKAGYNFGWDWGPRFVTAGIWLPVHLDSWSGARIATLHLQQHSITADRATASAELDIPSDAAATGTVSLTLETPTGQPLILTTPVTLDPGANHLSIPVRVDHPQLWWPAGYGAQPLYRVTARLVLAHRPVDSATLRTGLRSLQLSRQPDQYGRSFTFVVNGVPIFAKGANLVPLDSFPPSVTPAKKRAVLQSVRDANMNMLRIWGGGYYETDDFYAGADELGILLWHDFMFGGGMIPTDPAFIANVKIEARQQVARLSDHPSMALWCGNNELETAWNSWGDRQDFKKSITPDQRERVWQDYLLVFSGVLPQVVAAEGNGVPYWPSSPSADYQDVAGNDHDGDVHSWSVWSAGAPPFDYTRSTPRFLSEFGFQSMPALATVRAFAGNDEDLTSPALLNHERFIHGFDRMNQYLGQTFRPARDFAGFIYLSQLLQGEAIKLAVEHMRANRPRAMGTLYWQLDDCWPVASWASLDYYLRPKALQFYARRFYAPTLIAAQRAEPNSTSLSLFAVSDLTTAQPASVSIRVLRFDGTLLQQQTLPITLAALASTPVTTLDAAKIPGFSASNTVVALTLSDAANNILSTNTVYFTTPRDLALPAPTLTPSFTQQSAGLVALTLASPSLARAVQLDFGALDVTLSDDFFDVLPGQPHTVLLHTTANPEQLRQSLHLRTLQDATR